jgi:hypothetical protein
MRRQGRQFPARAHQKQEIKLDDAPMKAVSSSLGASHSGILIK